MKSEEQEEAVFNKRTIMSEPFDRRRKWDLY